jgi:hypothetical protein
MSDRFTRMDLLFPRVYLEIQKIKTATDFKVDWFFSKDPNPMPIRADILIRSTGGLYSDFATFRWDDVTQSWALQAG